ncbi:hypothetical protein [Chryseobacterium sp. SC28]|jgi:hypothetical protein|nr:hypothetical protein [Chryseobacterium sp. SC28]
MMTEKQIEFFELLQKMQQKNHDLLPYLQGENLFRGIFGTNANKLV